MLSIYQECFSKAIIRRIYRLVSSQTNTKRVFVEILEGHGQSQKFIGWARPCFLLTLNTSGFFVSNALGKVVDLTTLNILRTARAMLMNFCIVNTPRGQILICGCKVFCLFQQIFACGKVKGNTTKWQKTSAFKHFLFPKYSRNELYSEIKSNPATLPTPPLALILM